MDPMDKIYAYAWFRRPISLSPGNWTPASAPQFLRIIHHLRKNKVEDPGAGNIVHGNVFSSRYDYVYVKIEVPASAIEGLEEV